MKKFAVAAAAATALTLSMANGVFAAEATQAPVMLAATDHPVADAKQETSDTWITTKVKADLLTEKGIPGSDIEVETSHGVVTLASKGGMTLTAAQKKTAVNIAEKIKGVKSVSSDALKTQ